MIEEYDKMAFISSSRRKEVYNLLNDWQRYTKFVYSWKVRDEFAQKLLKFRDEFTVLGIPSIYKKEVTELYEQMRKETSYIEKRKIFAKIKEYTVPMPIWMAKIKSEEGFPIVDVFYDKVYGVRKEVNPII